MVRFISWLLAHRVAAILVLCVSVAAGLYAARNIEVRFQFRDFYEYATNPNLPVFKQYSDDFGDPAGSVAVLVEAADVFRPDVLEYVQRIATALQPHAVFGRIDSLASAPIIEDENDEITTGGLYERLRNHPEHRERLKRKVLNNPLFKRRLVSSDGKVTVVLARLRTPAQLASIDEQEHAIAAGRRALVDNPPPPGIRVRVTGAPFVEVETTRLLLLDQFRLVPLALAVLLGALFFTFRSLYGIVLPLTTVVVALAWTAGLFSLMHRPLDILNSCAPAMLLVYGVVDPIFVFARFQEKLGLGRSRREAILESQAELALPCFLTSLTTAVGFATFAFSPLPTMRTLGVMLASGVLLAWVTTVTVLPLLLAVFPTPRVQAAGTLSSFRWIDRSMAGVWSFVERRTLAILVVAVGILTMGVVLGRNQKLVNEYVGLLPNNETQASVRFLERELSGVVRLVVYVQGEPGAMARPEVLSAIAAVDRAAEKLPEVATAVSLADLLRVQHQAFTGSETLEALPKTSALITQYLTLLDPAIRSDFVSDDYASTHIPVFAEDRGSAVFRELAEVLERDANEAFRGLGVKVSITGNGIVGYQELDRVVKDLLLGFAYAFMLIVVLQWILFRSARLALISVVPNLIPFVICLVATSLFGISLRFDNSLVLCVAIGGLFNTTIHFSARMLVGAARQPQSSRDQLTEVALRTIGPPAFYTMLVLSLGMLVMAVSQFPALRMLGLLSVLTLVTGFASDILVTSALMRLLFRTPSTQVSRVAESVGG